MVWHPLPDEEQNPVPSVKVSLDRLAQRLGVADGDTTAVVFSKWAGIVGSEIATHAKPQSLVNGVLVVTVEDLQWVAQMRWLGAKLVSRINEDLHKDAVKKIEVRLQRSGQDH